MPEQPMIEQFEEYGLTQGQILEILTSDYSLRDNPIEQQLTNKIFRRVLNTISKREREFIYLLYWEGFSRVEVGRQKNISRSRVGQIEKRAIRKLRHPTRLRALMGKDMTRLIGIEKYIEQHYPCWEKQCQNNQ